MSQDDLATSAGLSKRTIGNYERGRSPEGAGIPDGYYLVATALGWSAESVDAILAGGEPMPLADRGAVSHQAVQALSAPVFSIADLARDAGAPDELVTRFRASAVELVGWLSSHHYNRTPRTLGEAVHPDDAETMLDALEGDGDPG